MAIEAISGRILAVIFLHDWRWCSSNDLRVPYSRCMASVTVGGWKLIHQQVQNEPFLVSSLSPWPGESQRFETRADELSCHLTGMHAKWLQLEHNCGCDRWKRLFSLLVFVYSAKCAHVPTYESRITDSLDDSCRRLANQATQRRRGACSTSDLHQRNGR